MKLLTLNEVADVMKVSISTVRRIIRGGSLVAYKIGERGQLRIKEEELERYLEAQIVQTDRSDNQQQNKAAKHLGDDE